MLPNENIFTYIERIKELQTAIIDETIRASLTNGRASASKVTFLKALLMDCLQNY